MSLNYQLYKLRNSKLPLSILIHYNTFFSLIFAILEGQLALEKHRHYYFCNKFQRDLLLPVYFTWVLAETTRMHVGQKGTLRGRFPELAAFLLLSVFPQIFSLLYLGFLQGITVPLDKALSCIMIAFVVLEIFMAWKLLRGIVDRQTALFNVGRGISTGEKEDEITENTKDARCSASEYAREGER